MSMEDEYNVAARYRTVRKHLDNLGYKQALTLDALPLIEKLLADLIQTTESLKHFKSIAQENIEAHTQLQSIIDPYKCDNVRLVQECNQLHLDLIKEKESHQKQIKDFKKEIYKLERECNDLQLASSRNLHRIKELETESSKKSKRILELQGKCLKPTISNVGLASKKRPVFPLRRPVIEGEPLPRTGAKCKNPLPNLSTVEPKVVDLVNMADHKMNCLSHEVTKLKGELSLQIENVHMLKNQLTTKEKEILRLKKMLDGGRPYSAIFKDCACKQTDEDNIDVDELKILQQEKLELEQQLKEALNKQHDAMTQALKLADRNEELEKELRDIDHIALAVEADCNSTVKENNKRVSKLQQKLEEVMTQVHILESELTAERREVQELKANLEACRMEKNNIQRNLESTLNEKKQMTDRINELIVIERNLNDEIDRLARENEKQKEDIIQLQYSNKQLKDQMNTQEFLQGKRNDDNRGQNGIKIHETHKESEVQNGNGVWYNNLKQTVEQLRRERDFYREEYNKVKDYHSKTTDKDHADLWTRIRELKLQLSEKESAVDELQREKKDLYREKINLETRLHNYKAEHKSSCRPCNVCKRSTSCNCALSAVKDISKAKSIIERLEHERNIARADVERLIEERDALRERLKMAVEAHTSEQHRLRENLTDVEARLQQIEKERQELLLTQGARRATINGLQDQLQDLREELKRTKQELGTQRTQYFQLRALQDQTDQALGDAQNQLTQSKSELNKALDRNKAIERQQLQLENQVKDLQQEINNLKSKMAHLDHEKDQLLMVVDEKTERIAALEREIMMKDQQVMGSEQQIRELQQKNEITVNQSAEQGRQLRMTQLEVENLQRQLQTASYDRENAIQENQRIQDDLAAVTCEVRNLQRELETSRAECSDLKRQLQTYVGEVRRAEELLNRKENERTEMLNHFRSLSLEATVLENNNHSLESEAAEARGALQSTRDRLLDLERQLADKDTMIRGYETQISELTQNVASMETQLRQQGEQRHRAEADLNAVRDLCVKLDQQKDSLMQQLDDKDALKTQYDMQIAKLKAEQAVIQDQMSRDRATVERLEVLLDQARQESMTVQANNQELQNEMSRLRQKMSELQNKLSSESGKLRQYQTQAAEYCKQISELRRQVTNERFDRARKEEETRRHSEGLPDSLVQTPPPNNQIPSNSNDTGFTTHRYFQNEKYEEHDESNRMRTTDVYAMSRFGCLNTKSNSKCNNCPKEMRRDVSCINIILRSDCKMHSNQYNCVQKEDAQNENEPATQDIQHLIQTNMLGLDSSNKNYHSICCNADNHFNMSQTMGIKYEAKLGRPSRQQFSSPNEQYNYAACVRENSLNVSQSGMRNEAKCNQCTEQSISNNTPQIEYGKFSRYPFHSTEISDDATNTKLISSKINSTNLGKSDQNNKIERRFDAHTFDVNRDIKSHPKISWKDFPQQNSKNKELVNFEKSDTDKQNFAPVPRDTYNKPLFQNSITLGNLNLNSTSINEFVNSKFQRIEKSLSSTDYKHSICTNRVQNILKNSYGEHTSSEKTTFNQISSTRKKLNFSVQDDINPCTDTNCTKINCSASSIKREKNHKSTCTDIKSTNDVTTNTFLKSKKNVCCNEKKEEKKCTKTIDTVLDTLQDMLNEVKKLEDTGTVKQYAQDSCYQEVRCKNMDCNYLDGRHEVAILECKHNSVKPQEIITPECMKMLQEIKEYTKTLEEQLMIMNKSMKIKKKTIEKLMPTVEYVMDLKYNQSIYNTRQQRDIITQNPEKRNICIQEPSKDINCVNCPQNTTIKMKEVRNEKQDLALPEINKKSKYQSEKKQESKNFKEEEIKDNKKENYNVKVTFNVQDQIKRHDNIKKTQNVQVQCVRSFHIIDPLNCRPLSTCMCNKGVNVSNDKNSPCIQTCVANKKNLYTQRIDKTMIDKLIIDTVKMKDITNSVNVNNAQQSLTYEERAIMMLLLAKGISNKCLKSKYKKSEFITFRPKCITNSCISCDQRSVKCKSSKQKMQIPVVFKQSEAIKSRIEGNICCNQSKYECSPKQLENDYQLSNLMTVCTQSSNLQITTATSVSCSSISTKSVVDNVIEEKRPRGDSCILS